MADQNLFEKYLPYAIALGVITSYSIHYTKLYDESLAGGVAVGVKIKGNENECSLESVVSGACGIRMQKTSETLCGAGAYSTIRFEQAKRYRVETGVAKVNKGDISGDSQVAVALKDGSYNFV